MPDFDYTKEENADEVIKEIKAESAVNNVLMGRPSLNYDEGQAIPEHVKDTNEVHPLHEEHRFHNHLPAEEE